MEIEHEDVAGYIITQKQVTIKIYLNLHMFHENTHYSP